MAAPSGKDVSKPADEYLIMIIENNDYVNQDSKNPKKINSLLNSSRTKQVGLSNLSQLLISCSEDEIIENASNWIKSMSQIIVQSHESLAARQLAAINLHLILKHSSQVPASCREISSNLAGTVLTNLLQPHEGNTIPILSAIESLLTYYPNACGASRSRIVKYTLPLMTLPVEDIRTRAIRCWSLIPFLGGGGSQRSTHVAQWEGQMDQTLQAIHFALQHFVGDDVNLLDPSIGSLSLPLPQLPEKEPDASHVLVQRLCTFFQCVHHLLDNSFPAALPVPMDEIMNLLLSVLDISPASMGSTSEMLLRASRLHLIHGSALKLFCKLTQICRRNLCRYSSTINRSFSFLLDLWKDKSPTPGRCKKHNDIRTIVYNAIMHWIQFCGATCRFLCGPSHQNQSLLRHLTDDITPVKSTLKISSQIPEKGGRAKRRKLSSHERSSSVTSGRIEDTRANARLCSGALEVILASVSTMGTRLSPTIHKNLQKSIITILLQIQQGKTDVIPYRSCPSSRLLLYKVVLSLVQSPCPTWPPPVPLSMKVFTFAACSENDVKIRSFCSDAICSMNNIIHPWRTAWHRCSVDVELEQISKKTVNTEVFEPLSYSVCKKCGKEDLEQEADESLPSAKFQTRTIEPQKIVENGELEDTTDTEKVEDEHVMETNNLNKNKEQSEINGDSDVINGDDVTMLESIQNDVTPSPKNVSENEDDATDYDASVTASVHVTGTNNGELLKKIPEKESEKDKDEVSEDVEEMLLDFVDASPEDDEKINE